MDADTDPDGVTDDQASELLEEAGLPDGANAEIAVCLLMCGRRRLDGADVATSLTIRARDWWARGPRWPCSS